MLDLNPELHLHYHKNAQNDVFNAPVESILGTGNAWTKEVIGDVHIVPSPGRTTLQLQGSGAMKINGTLRIGG